MHSVHWSASCLQICLSKCSIQCVLDESVNNEVLALVLLKSSWSLLVVLNFIFQDQIISVAFKQRSLNALHARIHKNSFLLTYILIDLFCLSILFSQYRSPDDTQESNLFESWTFSCSHVVFLMNTANVQTSEVSSHALYWKNKIDKRKSSLPTFSTLQPLIISFLQSIYLSFQFKLTP